MILIEKNCVSCGVCVDVCPVTALRLNKTSVVVDAKVCIDCGICAKKCPFGAIIPKDKPGKILIRDIRFQVTRKCNFHCPWCFSDAKNPLPDELSLEEAFSVVDQLIACGLKTMTLTGGESLLRKDFSIGLLKYLHRKKIYAKLFTNGSLFDERIIRDIAGIVDEVQISVYPKNSWPRIRRLFGLLKKYKIRAVMRITLTSRNYRDIKKLISLAEKSKVDCLRVRPFIAKGRGEKHKGYLLNRKALESIKYLVSIRRGKKYPIQLLAPAFAFLYDKYIKPSSFLNRGFIGYTLCKCIEDMGTILPDGRVRACGYFPQDFGNIKRQNFREIWSKKNKIKSQLIVDCLDKECMDCEYITICGGGCRANAYVNMGSLTARDPNCPKNLV